MASIRHMIFEVFWPSEFFLFSEDILRTLKIKLKSNTNQAFAFKVRKYISCNHVLNLNYGKNSLNIFLGVKTN